MSTQDAPGPPCRWCEQPTTITDERTIDGQDIIRFVCQPCRQLRDAAPDLLAALKRMLEHGTRAEWDDDILASSFKLPVMFIRNARAAIAKAEED